MFEEASEYEEASSVVEKRGEWHASGRRVVASGEDWRFAPSGDGLGSFLTLHRPFAMDYLMDCLGGDPISIVLTPCQETVCSWSA